MSSAKVVVVIPARYGSTRLPGKPLVLLAGKPMIQRVFERAKLSKRVHHVIVATDDERIVKAVQEFGGEARMTRPDHRTGTERVAEVAAHVPQGPTAARLRECPGRRAAVGPCGGGRSCRFPAGRAAGLDQH